MDNEVSCSPNLARHTAHYIPHTASSTTTTGQCNTRPARGGTNSMQGQQGDKITQCKSSKVALIRITTTCRYYFDVPQLTILFLSDVTLLVFFQKSFWKCWYLVSQYVADVALIPANFPVSQFAPSSNAFHDLPFGCATLLLTTRS